MISLKTWMVSTALIFGSTSAAVSQGIDENGDPIPMANYEVVGGEIQSGVDPKHILQWRRFNELIPSRYHSEIVQFSPIDSEASEDTDGMVVAVDDSRKTWTLMLDTTGAVPAGELDRNMVHEFAHLMTLRLSQVPDEGQYCETTLSIAEGCPNEGSYIDAFTDTFFPDYRDGEEELDYYPDEFVTEYAATSILEDIAESFAKWVVHPENWDGDTIADQKVRFFEAFPELVALKKEIRRSL